MHIRTKLLLPGCVLILGLVASWLTIPTAIADERQRELEFFEARIRPVLVEYCYECHNDQRREGGLALDSRQGLRAGGDRQKELDAGAANRNLILEAIRHEHDDLKMPDGGAKLSQQSITDFEKWFAGGAFDPRDQPPALHELEPENLRELVFDQRAKWWSLQPLSITATPVRNASNWPAHPIDRFVFAAMRDHGLEESIPADRDQLLRRLSFALVGLPPQATGLAEFNLSAKVNSDDKATESAPGPLDRLATDAIIDGLLASPQFGERWARHWMDWIRYAESHGSEGDPAIPYAHEYRDYLVRALNADVPYDQLVEEHLAGDLLESPRFNSALGINESAIGPAHLRMVFHGFAPTDALEEKVRFVDDQIAAVSKAFLGLTVACARCHDHKFDAIRQADYYAMFGILGSCHPGIVDVNTPQRQRAGQAELDGLKSEIREQVAASWLAVAESVFDQAIAPTGELAKAVQAADAQTHTLFVWKKLSASKTAENLDQPLSEDFARLLAEYRQRALQTASLDPDKNPTGSNGTSAGEKSLTQENPARAPLDLTNWFAYGNGTVQRQAPAGEFTLASTGLEGLNSILTAGHYSHLRSTRHRNVLLSPRIDLDDDYEIWLLLAGDGSASVRYAVQDYPRDGTVYPVTVLNGREWRWQKYDLSYWRGDSVHIELATAGDAPVLARPVERSWFGIRDARLVRKGSPAPAPVEYEQFAVLTEAYYKSQPRTLEQLRVCWTEALQKAIGAWRAGTATNAQAALLDAWLRAGLLPNTFSNDDPAADVQRLARTLKAYRDIEQDVPLPTRAPGVLESVGADQPLYVRGDHRQRDRLVPRGFISALDASPIESANSGRLALARKFTGASRALLARVIVNRLWHHLFGRGLVATPDNFGKLGETPSHPELLDYLAQELIDHRWSLKHIIRLIVTSQTWQQTSQVDAAKRALDPENVWLARAPLKRLEAEAIRDAQLAISGRLDLTTYGPSVDGNAPRRSLYLRVFRNALEPQLRAFDFPEPTSTVGRRDVTNVPAQSLLLLNNPRIRLYAQSWASETLAQASAPDSQAITKAMFRAAFGRDAEPGEAADVLALEQQLHNELNRKAVRRNELSHQIAAHRRTEEQVLAPVRAKLFERTGLSAEPSAALPQPVASWEFDQLNDASGKISAELHGDVRLQDSELIARGGFFKSSPLPFPLAAKTLEVWLALDDLHQRGGGAMSVQTPSGEIFDSIVFGEHRETEWLAGSNVFARTKPFDGPSETEVGHAVHIAVTYAADGRITGYRNGQPYGQSYVSSGLQTFEPNQAVVTFGCRHLPAGGNKQLSARWLRARLYDRALSAIEVAASFRSQPREPELDEIVSGLMASDRVKFEKLRRDIAECQSQLAELGEAPSGSIEQAVWSEIALALMNAKEFIFVK